MALAINGKLYEDALDYQIQRLPFPEAGVIPTPPMLVPPGKPTEPAPQEAPQIDWDKLKMEPIELEGDPLFTPVKYDPKRNKDLREINTNETAGDFQSRFSAVDTAPRMAPEATEKLTDAFKSSGGMVTPGNIDLTKRPVVKNEDGSISTVRSMSANFDGKEVLIPTVAHDGSRILSNDEAIQQYKDTGLHLGEFATPEAATAYADKLHKDQEAMYAQPRSVMAKLTGSDGGERFQTWPEKAVREAFHALAAPGEAYQGKLPMWAADPVTGEVRTSPQAVEKAAELAELAVFGPAPVAKKMADGTLGSFAGVTSKTLDKSALEVAQAAEREGLGSAEIWHKTGFFRGADKRWRYEIDDSGAKYKPPDGYGGFQVHKLGDILDHPELYEAYPALKSIKVIKDAGYPAKGAYFDGEKIVAGPEAFKDKSIIMHEVQHAIQDKEAFAKGGSPGKSSGYGEKAYKLRYEDDINQLRPEFLKLQTKEVSGEFLSLEDKAKLDYLKHVFVKYAEYARAGDMRARENYLSLAGETEARNTATRIELTPIERTRMSPLDTQDTAYKNQIIQEKPIVTNPYLKPNYEDVQINSGGAGLQYSLLGDMWNKVTGKEDKTTVTETKADALSSYPSEKDAEEAIKYGFGYGSGNENYIDAKTARILGMTNKKGEFHPVAGTTIGEDKIISRLFDENVDLTKIKNLGERAAVGTSLTQAALAVNRNPIAAVGFKPDNILLDIASGKNVNIAGLTFPENNTMYANTVPELRSAIVHESIHAGLNTLQKEVPEAKKIMEDLGFSNLRDETLVRYLMYKYAGDPEANRGDGAKQQRQAAINHFSQFTSERLPKVDRLMELAAEYLKDKRPRGPK